MLSKLEKYILALAIKFIKKELGIENNFNIKFSYSREGFTTTGYFNNDTSEIGVYCKGRALPDILRTLAHEFFHKFQSDNNLLGKHVQNIGGKIENDANAWGGIFVKKFAAKLKKENNIDVYTM